MRLPNADAAHVDRNKLTRYLLSETHPIGRWKARFFRGVGFDEAHAEVLEQGLVALAGTGEVVDTTRSRHGVKYTVEGVLKAPTGADVRLRTVWIVHAGEVRPQFVTAYPV